MTRTPIVHPVEQTETASAARLRRIASAHLLDNQLDHNQHGVTAPSLNRAAMHGRQLAHGGTLRGVRIRTKDSGDTAACVRLVTDIHRTDGYPQPLPADPAAFVTPSYETVAWVAESDGRIIGHVALHHPALDPTLQVAQRVTGLSPNRLALVARLLVDPTRRRLGVGRQLLAAATGHAASLGQRAVLDVFRDAGAPIALYEAAGWIRVDALTLAVDDGTSLQLWVYLAPTDGHR